MFLFVWFINILSQKNNLSLKYLNYGYFVIDWKEITAIGITDV